VPGRTTALRAETDSYAILEIELARVRESDANARMQSMMHLDNPTLDWVKIAEGQGVPASRATTAEEFAHDYEEPDEEDQQAPI
jgi:acetolactate synthase I/II/III large subunit